MAKCGARWVLTDPNDAATANLVGTEFTCLRPYEHMGDCGNGARERRFVAGKKFAHAPPLDAPGVCCAKARFLNCVCAHSYNCPEHGAKHIGSHD